ncbi:MAG TPA: transketolase C-terminal domain-containing protein [Gammaproteobacteria bacterium]|nr:transketolase C-terminal domain-containing protein [Gammaproteobacteria bacterium]
MNITLAKSLNQSLLDILDQNEKSVLIGEDIAQNGGVFKITENLYQKHPNRVINSPIAETLLGGLAVGLSTQGMLPIIEFQFSGFMYPAMEQIIHHAARMRNRTRGRLTCPIIYRAPFGGGIGAPEHHSESPEAYFAHTPGLRVIIPSCPEAGDSLLKQSAQCQDPVIFLEPKRIYQRLFSSSSPSNKPYTLGKANVWIEGKELTMISWGAMLLDCYELVKQNNIHADLIDLSSIKPIDWPTLIQSIQKTSRCVIVQESPLTCSVGSEIASYLSRHCFSELKAPIEIVSGYDTIMPYYQLEQEYLPSSDRIEQAICNVLEYEC